MSWDTRLFEIVYQDQTERLSIVFGEVLDGLQHIDYIVQRIKEGVDPMRLYDKGPLVENFYNTNELEFQRYGAAILGQINKLEEQKRNFIRNILDYNILLEKMAKEKRQFDKKCARDTLENQQLKQVIYGLAKDKNVSIEAVIEPEKSSLDSMDSISVPDSKIQKAIDQMEPPGSIGDTPDKGVEIKKNEQSEKKSKGKSDGKSLAKK